MANLEPTDRRAVTSPENGRKGGRTPTREKYASVIKATEKELANILAVDVPPALRELVRGVWVMEPGDDGKPIIYQRPPDLRAIELILKRFLGEPKGDTGAAAAAIATVYVQVDRPS